MIFILNTVSDNYYACVQIPELPEIVQGLRFYVQYRPVTRSYYSTRIIYPSSDNDTNVMFTITSLSRDTQYSIKARVEMQYASCSNYIYGNFSDPEVFQTNASREYGVNNYIIANSCLLTTWLHSLANSHFISDDLETRL